MYPSSPLHHMSSRDLNSCRYNCHSYSHTLQYFPSGLPMEPQPPQRPQQLCDSSSYNMPSYAQADRYKSIDLQDNLKYHGSLTNNWKKGSSGKAGQQRRCWNTANFQWMNIKRERKLTQGVENGESFQIVSKQPYLPFSEM